MTKLSQDQLHDFLVETFATLVKIKPSDVDARIAFDRYGLDSAAAVEFTGLIGARIGAELEPTLLYDHSTIELLEAFLLRSLAEKAA